MSEPGREVALDSWNAPALSEAGDALAATEGLERKKEDLRRELDYLVEIGVLVAEIDLAGTKRYAIATAPEECD